MKALSLLGYALLGGAVAALIPLHMLLARGPIAVGVQAAGVALVIWARVTFGARSFHAAANPTEGGLVTSGPYRFVRHPIYSGALLLVAPAVATHFAPLTVAIGVCAIAGVAMRIAAEERLVRARYPEYADYAARTKRLLPWVVCLLALASSACETHTVAVFASAADVAPRTVITAAVRPGRVVSFPAGTRLEAAHLAPSDTVVVRAESGDVVGPYRVRRRSGYDALVAIGYVIAIGGSVAALVITAAGTASDQDYFGVEPILWGILTAAGSLSLGGAMAAAGKNGELVIEQKPAPPRGAGFLLPFTFRF